MALDETIRDQAAGWAVRTGDPGFEDWDAFTAWLEADPVHARAYDEVMLAVNEASEALPALPVPDNDEEAVHRPPRRWFGGAIAAGVALAVAAGVWQMMPGTYVVETSPGEVRLVELEGVGQIEIAGGSRIILDQDDARVATLESGQALFTIERSPFTLRVGEDTLLDVGTVFDVKHDADEMALAVSEGAVVFNPQRQNVTVTRGQRLTSRTGSAAYSVATLAPSEVGEWREGRLTFHDATLSEVAADLTRLTGVSFTATSISAQERVSGSVLLGPVESDPRQLATLLGLPVRHNGEAWEIGIR